MRRVDSHSSISSDAPIRNAHTYGYVSRSPSSLLPPPSSLLPPPSSLLPPPSSLLPPPSPSPSPLLPPPSPLPCPLSLIQIWCILIQHRLSDVNDIQYSYITAHASPLRLFTIKLVSSTYFSVTLIGVIIMNAILMTITTTERLNIQYGISLKFTSISI